MSRRYSITDEVATLLGSQQVARLRGPEGPQQAPCWKCEETISASEDAAVVILLASELEDKSTGGGISVAVLTHPRCQGSQVLRVQAHEINRQGDDVTVVPTVLDGGENAPFPVVLVSYSGELIAENPQSDRVDMITTMLLEFGWQQISTLDVLPGPGPAGWWVRFTHDEGHAAAPGLFQLINPDGHTVTEAYVHPGDLWRPAAARTGTTAVMQGSRFLSDDWDDAGNSAIVRAIQAGLLTGGVVPVDLVGPGNSDTEPVSR